MIVMPQEKSRELVPAGSHLAICFRVIDLGTQATPFGPKRQIMFGFELPDEHTSDGWQHTISRKFTYSSDKRSALRGEIESWLGRQLTAADFGRLDLGDMLGRSCTLGIRHDVREGRTFANVASIMKPPKGVAERLSPTNPAIAFSLADEPFRIAEFEALPGWLQSMIGRSPEYAAAIRGKAASPMTVGEFASLATTGERLRQHLADHEIPF